MINIKETNNNSLDKLKTFSIICFLFLPPFANSKVICHDYQKYKIIESETKDGVGTNFIVKYKNKYNYQIDCNYLVKDGDLEIKNEFAEYFLSVQRNFLMLDSGTSTEKSFILWDLNKKIKAFVEIKYSEPYQIYSNYVEF